MLLADLARASAAVAATPRRLVKAEVLAGVLGAAEPAEVPVVVAYLSGELPQRRTGVGWATLRDAPPPAPGPTLRVLDVDAVLHTAARLAGPGSQAERRRLVHDLLARATTEEQAFLRALVGGELRQGALDAVVLEGVARATGVPLADLRRAVMLRGAAAPVAAAVLQQGSSALDGFRLEVGRPVQPMLASPADGVDDALGRLGTAAVEWKLDGIRLQVHRRDGDVRVWTRSLDEVTDRLPEVVDAVAALPARSLVLDGEAVALRPDGRPYPFQVTAARTGSRVDVASARVRTPLSALFFDVLHLDGQDLLAEAAADRHAALQAVAPASLRVPRTVAPDAAVAGEVLTAALGRGHEGVVVKALDAPYEAGRRGGAWLKVKPVHTLDLVVLAAEWGHGRRAGRLSNLHLGARDGAGGFTMLGKTSKDRDEDGWTPVGKTFKGMTDEMLTWQTERFLDLETRRDGHVVYVRPEQVVEIAFDGVQRSDRYRGGVALRFARVIRYRDDKDATEADTIQTLRALLP